MGFMVEGQIQISPINLIRPLHTNIKRSKVSENIEE